MANKIWAKGIYYKEIDTKNGTIRKLSFHREKFINWLNEQETSEKGYVVVQINKLREPDQYKNTHELILDTWKPDGNRSQVQNNEETYTPNVDNNKPEDDLPF